MSVPPPHYLLFSQAQPRANPHGGRWHFVLQSLEGETDLEAADEEQAPPERLELLAVVRGLEALEQPSRVTLVTPSKYVCHGLRFGVTEWRENGFMWERFGQLAPIKHSDLWKRVDQALQIHDVACRSWQLETNDDLAQPAPACVEPAAEEVEELSAQRPTRRKRIVRIEETHTPREGPAKTDSENSFRAAWVWLEGLWRGMRRSGPLMAGSLRSPPSSPPRRPRSRRTAR